MKTTNKLKTIAILMLCLPFFGGWTVALEQSDRYVGGELIATYANEIIPYASREVISDITTPNGTPSYYAVNGMQNACGPVAGGIIVGYYDKYYENLIPDWTAYYASGKYRIHNSTYVTPMIQDLYDRMQTNVVAEGVSENEFKNGLKNYVTDHGYNLQYISLGTGNSFNINLFKAAINNNEVSVLFVQPSNIYIFQIGNNQDILTPANISGNHIMVAYGYYEVKYIFSDGTTRTDKYLRVATGWPETAHAFYKIGSYIDAAYEVKIN